MARISKPEKKKPERALVGSGAGKQQVPQKVEDVRGKDDYDCQAQSRAQEARRLLRQPRA